MTRILMLTVAALPVAVATACSSGGGGGASTRNYSDTAGTAAKALADGKTLDTQEGGSAAQNLNYTTGDTGLTQADVQIEKNANGELSLIVNGVRQDFTTAQREVDPNDGQIYGYSTAGVNGVWSGMWNHRGTLDEALDPNNPDSLQIWNYQTNQVNPNQPDVAGWAVVGTETRPAALAGMPTATYSGRTRFDTMPNTGWVNHQTSRTRNRGDVAMTADFGAATVSGTISNLTIQQPGQAETGVAGTIAMDTATISGNGFAGTLTPDATYSGAIGLTAGSGNYGGTFYGVNGEQVGGTMTMTGTTAAGGFNGSGFFYGNKN